MGVASCAGSEVGDTDTAAATDSTDNSDGSVEEATTSDDTEPQAESDDTEPQAESDDTEPQAESDDTEPQAESDDTEPQAESTEELGTADNPYPFGQAHSRKPGFLGAGWTISIDEVRTEGIGYNRFFADDDETRTCVAVIGTATLDSLDSEELTSNPFSFPEPVLIVNGAKVDPAILECDTEGLKAEGLTWRLDVELAPGGTTRWFEIYLVDTVDYDTVAIESTIYARP
jgi:hypothetical protein